MRLSCTGSITGSHVWSCFITASHMVLVVHLNSRLWRQGCTIGVVRMRLRRAIVITVASGVLLVLRSLRGSVVVRALEWLRGEV